MLAILGGTPVRSSENPLEDRWPDTQPEDMAAVNHVFETGEFVGIHSKEVEAFETEYAQYVGAEYTLALGSGTASLHAAVAAAGCLPGDEVIIPALTFVASANAVMHQVCIPVFADIDPRTYNIDPASVEEKISSRTRAIMTVDLHGLPADYDALRVLAAKHNLVIIDDAAHAVGAQYKGKRVGSLADITGASIMPAKQLATCGEGGMFSTNQLEYYNRASMIRMFGEVIQKGQPRAYNSYTLGYNYRLNPVQAAYGRSQLRRLDTYVDQFTTNGINLAQGLSELKGIEPPYVPEGSTHVYHMFRIKFDPALAGFSIEAGLFAQAVHEAMVAEGLPLRFYQSTPVPGQRMFRSKDGFGGGVPWSLPGAREINYDIEDYPVTLETLATTRCIGLSGTSGPNYFRNKATMELYLEGFRKLWENLPDLVDFSRKMEYRPPWTSSAPSTRGIWTVITPKTVSGG